MDDLRVIIAICIFSVSSYLVYDLFANGFNWYVLAASIMGYLLVHYIWPSKNTEDSSWYDSLEIIFDLPYRAIAIFFRGIGRLFRSSDGDIGIDL